MRRREETANAVWLKRLATDASDGRLAPDGPIKDSIESLLHEINTRHHYIVTIWLDTDAYRVRVTPIMAKQRIGRTSYSLSYSGMDLQRILAAAYLDLAHLYVGKVAAEHAVKESIRYVK